MTAIDELRAMLDERGVEHYDGTESTLWGYEDYNEFTGIYRFSADETSDGYMQVRLWRVTPEQAIAATLGDVPRLPHFWTHDGALHVELPKLPKSISVRLPDQRDREVGSARVWQYTRDSGTCQKVYLVETSDDLIESWHPIGVYLSSKAAGDCAEALRGEVDGIRQFARVVELKVVDEMMIALHEYAEKAQSENAKLLDENVRLRSCLSDDADNARQIMAENATLRQQLADVTESMGRVEERCAKLRELAGELWTYAEQELLCDENCPYGDTCDWMEPAVVCVFKRRMRELGVEVDE